MGSDKTSPNSVATFWKETLLFIPTTRKAKITWMHETTLVGYVKNCSKLCQIIITTRVTTTINLFR